MTMYFKEGEFEALNNEDMKKTIIMLTIIRDEHPELARECERAIRSYKLHKPISKRVWDLLVQYEKDRGVA